MNIPIPHGSILRDTITVDGYKFFYLNGQILCATCFYMCSQRRNPDIPLEKGKIAELILDKGCDCPKQEDE